jgi:hypothetical protein
MPTLQQMEELRGTYGYVPLAAYQSVESLNELLKTVTDGTDHAEEVITEQEAPPTTEAKTPGTLSASAMGISPLASSLLGTSQPTAPTSSIPASVAAPSTAEQIRTTQSSPAGDVPLRPSAQLAEAAADATSGIPIIRDLTAYMAETNKLNFYQDLYEEQVKKEADRIAAYQEQMQKETGYESTYDPYASAGISPSGEVSPPNPQVPIPMQGSTFTPTINIQGSGGLLEGLSGLDLGGIAQWGAIGLVAVAAIMLLK